MSKTFSRRRALKRIADKDRADEAKAHTHHKKRSHLDAIKARIVSVKANGRSLPQKEISGAQKEKKEHSRNERALTKATERLRDFTAALVLVGILGVVTSGLQWWEIHSGSTDTHELAEAAKNQSSYAKVAAATAHDAYIADTRAFVGPSDASIQPLVLNSSIKIVVTYKNTGKEPVPIGIVSRSFTADAEEYLINYPAAIAAGKQSCMDSENSQTGFAFPNSGFSQYSFAIDTEETLPKILVDQELIDGIKTFYIYGCFTYKSLHVVRHTAFCFRYTAKKTDISHLGICSDGWDAD